jgi:hypothetical protein
MAHRTDLHSLEISVSRTLRFVTAAVVAFLAAYFYWFFIANGQRLSSDTSAWGQFGDFMGGILNPLVAYSAFYWLTRSVLLQKEELLETRRALEASAAAQIKHAEAAEQSLKVAAYTALLNSSVIEVQTLRMQVDSLLERALKTPTGAARLPSGEWAQPRLRKQRRAGGVVPVLARPGWRASTRTPRALPRHPAGRRVLRV